jgi:DNA invertase Pin-like site-specific DNA recombinase
VIQSKTIWSTTALYCRVSTSDQDLSPTPLTGEYATDRLGVEPAAIEVSLDKQTDTDADHNGYQELTEALETAVGELHSSSVARIEVGQFALVSVSKSTV